MAHRNTPIPAELPEALSDPFGQLKPTQWQAVLRTSDVSDDEWAFVAPYLTLKSEAAPQREHSLREVYNGLRWLATMAFGSWLNWMPSRTRIIVHITKQSGSQLRFHGRFASPLPSGRGSRGGTLIHGNPTLQHR
jgi:hypothetical protein